MKHRFTDQEFAGLTSHLWDLPDKKYPQSVIVKENGFIRCALDQQRIKEGKEWVKCGTRNGRSVFEPLPPGVEISNPKSEWKLLVRIIIQFILLCLCAWQLGRTIGELFNL